MKKLLILVVAVVALGSISWAAISLNSSRSNIYRIIAHPEVMSQAQATVVVAEMTKLGRVNEATMREWLKNNLTRLGVKVDKIKEIRFVAGAPAAPAGPATRVGTQNPITIVFLTHSPDEPAALAAVCPECVPVRHPTSPPNL